MSLRLSSGRALAAGAGLALLAVASAPRAEAQTRLVFTPFFASYYSPTNYGETDAGGGVTVREKQTAAPALGGRITAWLNRGFGIEGSVSYALTGRQAKAEDSSGNPVPGGVTLDGTLIMASGRVLLRPRRSNLHFIVGGGWMQRGGDAWNDDPSAGIFAPGVIFNKSNVYGVLGFGVVAQVTPKFALDVGVEANLYSADRDENDTAQIQDFFESKFTPDILVTIGVPIGRR